MTDSAPGSSSELPAVRCTTRGGSVALLAAAAIWGFAFVAQRAGMEHVGPLTFNAARFAIGLVVLAPWLVLRRRRAARASDLPGVSRRAAVGTGLVLFVAATLQQAGLVHTTAGKAGFITGLYVVIVPLFGALLGRRVRIPEWGGAAVAAAGLSLLTLHDRWGIDRGDALVLGSALLFSVHVLIIDRLARRAGAVELAAAQFAVCASLSLLLAPLFESPELDALASAWLPILYAGALSIGVAYTLQVIGQRAVTPTVAAIVMSLEAVFAAVGGWLVLSETMTPRALAGCALMLGGTLVAQVRRRAGGST